MNHLVAESKAPGWATKGS